MNIRPLALSLALCASLHPALAREAHGPIRVEKTLSAEDLIATAREAAAGDDAADVKTLEEAGYFRNLSAGLERSAGSPLRGADLHRLAIGALSARSTPAREAFVRLAEKGFFRGPLFEALGHRLAEPTTAWREEIQPGEAELFEQSAAVVNAMQRKAAGPGNPPMRGLHVKQHAAVLAEVRVLPNLPPYLRRGVFEPGRVYKAWVRFSNGQGAAHKDMLPDLRGCAIKLMGVSGRPVDGHTASTQDFLLTNNPVLPVRNVQQYIAFQQVLAGQSGLLETLTKKFGLKEARRILMSIARNLKPPKSCTLETYWSEMPLTHGPYAMKLKLQPAAGAQDGKGWFNDADYLREDLRKRLAAGEVRFDLMAQFFVDPARTPIEDGAVEWKEEDAPFVKLAELVIAGRDLDSQSARAQNAFGNKLSFTPWHAVAEHRPIGALMRVRKAVYQSSARLRGHGPEPDGTERFE